MVSEVWAGVCQSAEASPRPARGQMAPRRGVFDGSVSKVEMAAPMGLIYQELYLSISTFETPPSFDAAQSTLVGIELMHMLRKGQLEDGVEQGRTAAEQF